MHLYCWKLLIVIFVVERMYKTLFHCTKSVLNDSMGGRICHLGRLRLKAVIFF